MLFLAVWMFKGQCPVPWLLVGTWRVSYAVEHGVDWLMWMKNKKQNCEWRSAELQMFGQGYKLDSFEFTTALYSKKLVLAIEQGSSTSVLDFQYESSTVCLLCR